MKWVLRSILAVLGLVVLAVAGVFVFLVTLNPNDYKGQISSAVQQATGRNLTISGDIRASMYPILGFTAAGITLSNPSGFGDKPFLTLESIQVGVQILPLLNRQVHLTTMLLDHPQIHVIKTKEGKTNLEFRPDTEMTEHAVEYPVKGKTSTETNPSLDIQVGQVKITNAGVTYDDREAGTITKIDPLNITIPSFTPGVSTRVTFDMTAQTNGMTIKVGMSGATMVSNDYKRITTDGMTIDIRAHGGAIQGEAITTLQVDGTMNIEASTVDMAVSDFALRFLETDFKGKATIKGPFATPAIEFSVSSPRVNLDKMSKGTGSSGGVLVSGRSEIDVVKKASTTRNQSLFPVAVLRFLNLKGDIRITDVTASGLKLENLETKISARAGDIQVAPITADFYDGKIKSQVRLNAAGAVPSLSVQGSLSDSNVGDIVTAKMGEDYLSGTGRGNIDLRMVGNSISALKQSASGIVQMNFEKGEIHKWKLSSLINQAITIYKTHKIAPSGADQLYFAGIKGSWVGSNGVFRNDDLILEGPKMHTFGNGTVNLVTGTVDYTVLVGDGTPDRTANHIPIRITGPITAPSYKLDAESILTDVLKDKIEKKLKGKLLDKLGPIVGEGSNAAEGDTVGADAAGAGEPSSAPRTPEDLGKQLLRGLLQ